MSKIHETRRYLVVRLTGDEYARMAALAAQKMRRPQDEGRRLILAYLRSKGYLKSEGQCASVSQANAH